MIEKGCHTCKYGDWDFKNEPCGGCHHGNGISKWEISEEVILREENKKLKEEIKSIEKNTDYWADKARELQKDVDRLQKINDRIVDGEWE